jgi:AcrR family transcriptional regulator
MAHGSPPTPRARRHDDNFRRIVETAMRMVEEGGLEALSINRLADAVDYTPGALYRYVDSKDALLSLLCARVLDDVRAHLEAALARLPPRATPLRRVAAIVDAYAAFAREAPRRFSLILSAMADPRVLLPDAAHAQPVMEAAVGALTPLATALADAADAGQLSAGPAPERAVCLVALMQGVLLFQKQARYAADVLDLPRLVRAGARSLLIGWGGAARTVDNALRPQPPGGSP